MAAPFHGGHNGETVDQALHRMLQGRALDVNSYSLGQILAAIEAVRAEILRLTVDTWFNLSIAELNLALLALSRLDDLAESEQARQAWHDGEPGFQWENAGENQNDDATEYSEDTDGELADFHEDGTLECQITHEPLTVGTMCRAVVV